jgi:hypothetical protein
MAFFFPAGISFDPTIADSFPASSCPLESGLAGQFPALMIRVRLPSGFCKPFFCQSLSVLQPTGSPLPHKSYNHSKNFFQSSGMTFTSLGLWRLPQPSHF